MIADRSQIDRMPVQGVITRADELLELSYRSADLGNLDNPLDEAVYILLTLQTRESVYRQVFSQLKATYATWDEVLESPVEELVGILRPGGFQERRAATLRLFLLAVAEENERRGIKGPLSLGFLDGMDNDEMLEFLVGLPGVGPKTARCIMSYSLQREVFAVDTHVSRVLERLGIIEPRKGKPRYDEIERLIPSKIRRRFHVNLVHHGRAVCRSRRARCGECVLVSFCATGQSSISGPCQKPKVVELFAGAGGLGYGFVQADFRVVLAVDNDRDAAQTYRLNHPGTPVLEGDVTQIDEEDIRRFIPNTEEVAVLLAGTPCQGYSLAGRRDPDDPSNRLYEEVARFADLLRPELVVIENVLGLRDVRGIKFVERIRLALTGAGYNVAQPARMRASEYGVSQNRVRFVFLARRAELGEAPSPPPPSHLPPRADGPLDGETLPRTRTLIETLSDLPDLGPGVELEYGVIEGNPIYNASTMSHAPHVIEKIKKIQPGKGPISYRRLGGTLAKTLIAGHRALPVHPLLDRTISVREAARIQGFPDSYVFAGVRSNQPLQVANAVPPPLARAIADHLHNYLS